jgi:protein involved in polysaccharide export with SLBB domain
MSESDFRDFAIGPGDVMHVEAAELPELTEVTVRVDGEGRIDLPLIGELRVAGLSEPQVREALTEAIRRYQKEPRVHVFVRRYESRNVYVMGMVAQPGSYPLESPSESLLSVLGRAGGIKGVGNEDAASMLVLLPGRSGDSGDMRQRLSEARCAGVGRMGASEPSNGCGAELLRRVTWGGATERDVGAGASVDPIVIDLSNPAMAACLDTPARPRDVVVVPEAGQVGVYGWVARPGSFSITPGMTALGAIASAGGAMFSSSAEVKRVVGSARLSIRVDLAEVESGKAADVPILAGDVVVVRGSVTGALPYAVYTIFSKFGTGLYMAPAVF